MSILQAQIATQVVGDDKIENRTRRWKDAGGSEPRMLSFRAPEKNAESIQRLKKRQIVRLPFRKYQSERSEWNRCEQHLDRKMLWPADAAGTLKLIEMKKNQLIEKWK